MRPNIRIRAPDRDSHVKLVGEVGHDNNIFLPLERQRWNRALMVYVDWRINGPVSSVFRPCLKRGQHGWDGEQLSPYLRYCLRR